MILSQSYIGIFARQFLDLYVCVLRKIVALGHSFIAMLLRYVPWLVNRNILPEPDSEHIKILGTSALG